MNKLQGCGVALVTPFQSDLKVDYAALKKLLQFSGEFVDYFVVGGTTGEAATLSLAEKHQILAFVDQNNVFNRPIVYGIGGNNTSKLLEEIEQTNFNGISAVLSVSPYYNKPSQSGIIQHYQQLADACPVPIILYNVPGRTGSNISAESIITLSTHPNIIGVKEASGDLVQVMQIIRHAPTDFMVISGDDLLTPAIISAGGVGVISVLANAFPIFAQSVRNCLSQNFKLGYEQLFPFLSINELLYEEGNPVGIKQVLQIMDISQAYVRPPLAYASTYLINRLTDAFHQMQELWMSKGMIS